MVMGFAMQCFGEYHAELVKVYNFEPRNKTDARKGKPYALLITEQ